MKYSMFGFAAVVALVALTFPGRNAADDVRASAGTPFRSLKGTVSLTTKAYLELREGTVLTATGADGTFASSTDGGLGNPICSTGPGGPAACSAVQGYACSSAHMGSFCSSSGGGSNACSSASRSEGPAALCSAANLAGEGQCSATVVVPPDTAQCSALGPQAFCSTIGSAPCSAFTKNSQCSAFDGQQGNCSTIGSPCSADWEMSRTCSSAVGGICSLIVLGSEPSGETCPPPRDSEH